MRASRRPICTTVCSILVSFFVMNLVFTTTLADETSAAHWWAGCSSAIYHNGHVSSLAPPPKGTPPRDVMSPEAIADTGPIDRLSTLYILLGSISGVFAVGKS